MRFKRFGDKFVLKLDRNEEIVVALKTFCVENNVNLGLVTGIGAVNNARLGLFDVTRKEFVSKEFSGAYELVGLTGNISTMNGQIYLHLHAAIADSNCNSFGGHLASAIVSAACEIIIDSVDGKVDRILDDQIGLNILDI